MSSHKDPLIWDLPTRLFHWALVVCITGSWFTAKQLDDAMEAHLLIGYTCMTLILFRLVWGFAGSRHARFSSFVKGPAGIARYTSRMRSDDPIRTPGHNPLGAISVIVMLLAIAGQITLGLFASDGFFYAGPYNGLLSESASDRVTDLHETGFNVIVVLIVTHVAAIIWYRVRKGENLVLPMISGRKPRAILSAGAGIASSRIMLAGVILAACGLVVWALVTSAPPPVDPFGF